MSPLEDLWEWADTGWPVAVDTETIGCDPSSESPVERAQVWCMTLAWGAPGEHLRTAFVPRSELAKYAQWLRSRAPKVGANFLSYDRHALNNAGITVDGLIGDVVDMSRLLDPGPSPHHTGGAGHSLKALGARLGFDVVSLKSVTSRRKPGAFWERKDGRCGQNLLKTTEMLPIDEVWRDYPQRREALVKYAIQDAVMTLQSYYWLRQLLTDNGE